jgi:Rft protein
MFHVRCSSCLRNGVHAYRAAHITASTISLNKRAESPVCMGVVHSSPRLQWGFGSFFVQRCYSPRFEQAKSVGHYFLPTSLMGTDVVDSWMAGFSVIYISAAVMLYALQLGDASLVYANILNLSVRIIYSAHFISSFFSNHSALDVLTWNRALPRWPVIITCSLSAGFIWTSARQLEVLEVVGEGGRTRLLSLPVVIHVMLGGVMGLGCLIAWWMSSGRYLSIPSRMKSE